MRRGHHEETNPLMPSNQSGDSLGSIAHKGSVFTYIMFMPPIARMTHGHYLTGEVILAALLFILTVTLQLCLTLIAGNFIVQTQVDMRASLVQESHPTESWFPALLDQLSHVGEHTVEMRDTFKERLMDWQTESNFTDSDDHYHTSGFSESCCREAACAGLAKCCPPTIKRKFGDAGTAQLLLRALERKPAGKSKAKKKGDQDTHSEDGAEVVPVCTSVNGLLSCMPPSVALIESWQELDVDSNGIWTIHEAVADLTNIGCRVGVPLEDFFRAACRGLVQDHQDTVSSGGSFIALPSSVSKREGIPYAYFEWWRGLAAVCINADMAMCGTIIHRGTFDGALTLGRAFQRGGIMDLDTTVSYCQRLLSPGGFCDAALPGAYVVYRARINEKCGVPNPADGSKYVNPINTHDVTTTMNVTWSNLDEYSTTHNFSFRFFMALILILWYINLVDELKDIIHLWDFIRNFPVEESWPFMTPRMSAKLRRYKEQFRSWSLPLGSLRSPTARQSDEDSTPTAEEVGAAPFMDEVQSDSILIEKIARPQKVTIVGMAIVRTTLLCYLAYSGTHFLLSNRSFIDLLLNALALAFIFEMDEFLYVFLVPEVTKMKLDSLAPLTYDSSLPSTGFAAACIQKHYWALFVIPILSWIVVREHDRVYTIPVLEALRCTCLKAGDACLASGLFNKDWFDNYWKNLGNLHANGQI